MTTKNEREQILALAGKPTPTFRRKGQSDFCTCTEQRYNELAQKPSLFEMRVFYTADQVIAARKPLEEEIERLKTVPMKYRRMEFNAQLQNENDELRQQLAKKDAEIEVLREHFEIQKSLAAQHFDKLGIRFP